MIYSIGKIANILYGDPLQYPCLKKIIWIEEPGGLQSMVSHIVRYNWAVEHKEIEYNL